MVLGAIKIAELTAAHSTTSGKIRVLASHGLSRQQIADCLGKSYQHVRQVLVEDERRREAGVVPAPASAGRKDDNGATSLNVSEPVFRIAVESDGRLTIPPSAAKALGLDVGRLAMCRIQDGELIVMSADRAMRKAQEIVRALVPPGVSLANELIAERRKSND